MTARTLVGFRTADGRYAVPVEHAREVRAAEGIVPLPAPRPGVVGLLPRGDEALPVLDALGAGSKHVLVLDAGQPYGLLVEEVSGVVSVEEGDVGPPPPGQEDAVIVGVVASGESLLLLVDATALAGSLA
ncbi:MAG TPA: chemotaxis protein CheW [Acidimicrobiales bacterium]|nr:chemotaxis protein CheW [Acidimicrobiales bacterium]